MLKRLLCSFVLLMNVLVLFAQQNAPQFWRDIAEQNTANFAGQYDRFIYPSVYRTIELDVHSLRNFLRDNMTENQSVVIELPMPDGSTERFKVWEESVMHPDLQAKYPDIRCFTGQGVDDPQAIIKCDITPQGFHAMTLGAAKGQMFIDPLYHGFDGVGIVYFKKDYERTAEDHFECHHTAEMTEPSQATELHFGSTKRNTHKADFAGDCQKRRYRLALACTGEYALFHGNTKPLVLAAMNTSMNRVNGVYERDFAVTMQLIPNNDTLIFLNSTTDPYTNNNGGTMLGQNQTTVTARIGAANYDIGHVFSTGGGGVAGLGVVCNNGNKARGVTGLGSPIGDAFDIDYVAHEIGHQFAGNHCYNNSCGGNINNSTAMEPGSGSTIMAYAGICAPNVQNNSDDYFHAVNVQEMANFITTGGGNSCPVKTVTGNNAPLVDNVPNYIIPKSTPFALTAVATDADNNPLTYCWEQMNQQSATMPPVSTSTGGPLFRSYDPVASGTRTFPRLPDLVTNTNSTWEELPSVARAMNFRVVVRDNSPLGGCTDEDDVAITVNGNSGPFLVSVPNTNVLWQVGENQVVTWDVANTTAAPVSCANVKISLSTDGGFTYPVVLAENVPNSGTASITVPNNISNTCRVKVEAVGNIFFDISNANFRIQAPAAPTFVLNSSSTAQLVCAGNEATVTLSTAGLVGFAQPITMSIAGLPVGATAVFNPTVVNPGQAATCTIGGLTSAMAGNYPVVITGTAGTIVKTVSLALTVLPGVPALAPGPSFPADAATGVGVSTILEWGAIGFAQSYTVEISTNPGFNPAVTLTSDTILTMASGLMPATPYYWRVKAMNNCGESIFGEVFAFQTGLDNCNNVFTNSTSQPIDVGGVAVINSTITVAPELSIADLNVSVNIAHEWVGDLDVVLFSPANDSIVLFDRPGIPTLEFGCEEDNIIVTFDDEATQTAAMLEDACSPLPPAISGTYRAVGSLSEFDGTNAQGTWRLRVRDNYPGADDGIFNSWSLFICVPASIVGLDGLLTNNPLNTTNAASKNITNAELTLAGATAADQKRFTLLSLPTNGTLTINGVAATVGQHFTQADINANAVAYVHNGNTSLVADQFKFDVLDQTTGGWLHNTTFLINIQQNSLSASSAVTQTVSCNNGTNGQITVTANGGATPLQYSLNGGTAQPSNVFGGLAAGTYTIVVSDANGFTISAGSATIANPTAIAASTSVSFDDLTVTATGGTGTLEYSIDDINYNETGLFENLTDGIYTYIVRDDNGCTTTGQVAVSVSALLSTVTQTATILCHEAAQAAITVVVAGGFSPYEYSISGNNFQGSNVFSGLVAGTYTVTVRDANGTTATANPIIISQPTVLSANATVAFNTVSLVATGGTAPYTYSVNGGAGQPGPVFAGLNNGMYTFTITDANGCTTSTTVDINIPALSLVSAGATGINPCTGVFNVAINATGGIPPLQYSITNGTTVLTNPTPFFNGLQPGSYTVVVTDAALSTVSATVAVAQPVALAATSSVLGNDATVNATGGTAPFTFTLANGVSNATGDFENLANGIYTVTVADVNGCTTTSSFTVNYSAMSISFVVNNVSCAGGNDGSIIWNISGGLPPYSFTTPFPQMNLAAGTYSVTATDAAGSSIVGVATVTAPPALALTATPNGNGTVTAAATGGTPPYSYSIDGGATYQPGTLFTDVDNGSYTLIVRDSKGCTFTTSEFMVSGIREVAASWGLLVTPNPSNGVFRLSLGNAPTGDIQWSVTDVLGRTIIAPTTQSASGVFQANIDLTQSPAGVYMLHLTNGVQHTTVLLEKM